LPIVWSEPNEVGLPAVEADKVGEDGVCDIASLTIYFLTANFPSVILFLFDRVCTHCR
jgi:hypothetical protein